MRPYGPGGSRCSRCSHVSVVLCLGVCSDKLVRRRRDGRCGTVGCEGVRADCAGAAGLPLRVSAVKSYGRSSTGKTQRSKGPAAEQRPSVQPAPWECCSLNTPWPLASIRKHCLRAVALIIAANSQSSESAQRRARQGLRRTRRSPGDARSSRAAHPQVLYVVLPFPSWPQYTLLLSRVMVQHARSRDAGARPHGRFGHLRNPCAYRLDID